MLSQARYQQLQGTMTSMQIKLPFLIVTSFIILIFIGCNGTKTIMTVSNPANEKAKMEQEAGLWRKKEKEMKVWQTKETMERDSKLALKIMSENAPKVRLNEFFNAIAYADNAASANSNITKALVMFNSSETPVLMVNREDGKRSYDRTMTIRTYFGYLKDQKSNKDDIKILKINASGKIIEVELKKNN
jgi:hypothetical protein